MLKPDVFVSATNVRLPEMDSDQEENDDDDVEQSAAIAEAFANDDVMIDFRYWCQTSFKSCYEAVPTL